MIVVKPLLPSEKERISEYANTIIKENCIKDAIDRREINFDDACMMFCEISCMNGHTQLCKNHKSIRCAGFKIFEQTLKDMITE